MGCVESTSKGGSMTDYGLQAEEEMWGAIASQARAKATGTVTIAITLRDGTSYSATSKRLPRYWKSAAMQLAPYGTDYRGCTFSRVRNAG